jgi:hypothetical protein
MHASVGRSSWRPRLCHTSSLQCLPTYGLAQHVSLQPRSICQGMCAVSVMCMLPLVVQMLHAATLPQSFHPMLAKGTYGGASL